MGERSYAIRVGVFAHNEEDGIADVLRDLSRQTIFAQERGRIRIDVLCNGCRDATVEKAREAGDTWAREIEVVVHDWKAPGKGVTWNRWVEECADTCEVLVFVDADIRIPVEESVGHLVRQLRASGAYVVTSRPVKDVSSVRPRLLRVAATRVVQRHEDGSICGQLYAARAEFLRRVRIPSPCLVEDGFLAASCVTNLFQEPPKPVRVKASPTAWHTFQPPASLRESFRHNVRLELGTDMNAAIFTALWAAGTEDRVVELMRELARGEGMDRCFEEHETREQNRSLRLLRAVLRARGSAHEPFLRRVVAVPWRALRVPYDLAVFRAARRAYRRRTFRW